MVNPRRPTRQSGLPTRHPLRKRAPHSDTRSDPRVGIDEKPLLAFSSAITLNPRPRKCKIIVHMYDVTRSMEQTLEGQPIPQNKRPALIEPNAHGKSCFCKTNTRRSAIHRVRPETLLFTKQIPGGHISPRARPEKSSFAKQTAGGQLPSRGKEGKVLFAKQMAMSRSPAKRYLLSVLTRIASKGTSATSVTTAAAKNVSR